MSNLTLSDANSKVGKYRWTICALLFFATTINYIDRNVISLLKPDLEDRFGWSERDYSHIIMAFQLAYAIGMVLAGRFIDKVGTKIGYAVSLIVWSIASMGHAAVRGITGFMMARGFLGISESANFPAAIKAVAEWFPKKERAFATGLLNSGTNMGAILAPLIVPYIAVKWGWREAFVITGALGFIWLIFWFIYYEHPSKQKRLSKKEFEYINSDKDEVESIEALKGESSQGKNIPWSHLLGYKQTWAFAVGKLLTDPIWWFYLFWLPAFLDAQYGLRDTAIALPVAVVYTMSSVGSIFGGWFPLYLIKKGWLAYKARKFSMLIYAFLVIPIIFAQIFGEINMWLAILTIGLGTFAHQAWSANLYTTVSDMFPKRAVGSVTGIGGMAGGIGGLLVAYIVGLLFDFYRSNNNIEVGYYIMFVYCGATYLIAWLIIHFIVPKMERVKLKG